MNGLGMAALLTIVGLAITARMWALNAAAERRRAEHLDRLLTIAREQRDRARAERDKADEFAEEALMISGLADAIAKHPSQPAERPLALSVITGGLS